MTNHNHWAEMRTLIFLLLSIGAQAQTETGADLLASPRKAILFADSTTTVAIRDSGYIDFMSPQHGLVVFPDALPAPVTKAIVECLYRVNWKYNMDVAELQIKINFYERHFGKLEQCPEDGCVIYTPNPRPEKMKPCKPKRDKRP